jgi:MFS family permease
MLITRKTSVPKTWAFYAQLTIILSIYGQFVVNAPFILLIKRYLDNPAAIMGLISIQIYVTFLGGPLVAWLSDRIWTRYGRRKIFVASADFLKALFLLGMPFAPNLWVLVLLRWLYDFFGDLGAPAQAMIWEVVPAKQRGLSAGFMKAFMNLGNLVFFTLLLGRFHDVYFLGPFQFFGTPSGGTLMFLLCVLLFLSAAIFEAVGIKETYPPGRKRLLDGRKPGEPLFKHFVRSVFADVFAKDLTPLYLLLFANIMFGFSLGVFQPLLFTEQWGYDLQTFGNTIAIGVPLGIALGLLGGWMADRYGKMRIVFWTTIGNLIVNLVYTAYVYFLPDYRPSFWEIVAFGNLAYIFGSIKGVASGPLLWEYVSRNRMGGATAGIVIFNAIFRNSIGVLVGLWLLVWSVWFFPQAGYNVTAFFAEELDRPAVMERAVAAGLDPTNVKLRPLHPPGVDAPTSRRWWIHQENDQAAAWIQEREDLQNKLGTLRSRLNSLFLKEAKRLAIHDEMAAARARITEIEEQLAARSAQLEEQLAPQLDPVRFRPGEQLRAAAFDGTQLMIEVSTVEPLAAHHFPLLRDNLQGHEVRMRVPAGGKQPEPAVDFDTLPPDHNGLFGMRMVVELDSRFVSLFQGALDAGLRSDRAFNLVSGIMAVTASQFSSQHSDFALEQVAATPPAAAASALQFVVVPTAGSGTAELSAAAVRQLFEGLDSLVAGLAVVPSNGGYQVTLELNGQGNGPESGLRFAEVRPRMAAQLGDDSRSVELAMTLFRKLGDTLAARPIHVMIPRHAVETGYTKRVYEYFFSSQILQIATDIFGIGILLLIIYLEKRGTLHRYGAEEDMHR